MNKHYIIKHKETGNYLRREYDCGFTNYDWSSTETRFDSLESVAYALESCMLDVSNATVYSVNYQEENMDEINAITKERKRKELESRIEKLKKELDDL